MALNWLCNVGIAEGFRAVGLLDDASGHAIGGWFFGLGITSLLAFMFVRWVPETCGHSLVI